MKNKVRNKLLYSPIIFIGIIVVLFGAISLIESPMCSPEEEYVKGTAIAIQDYYQENNSFPTMENKDFLDLVGNQYNKVDMFSPAGLDQFFVYFKTNCKLQIKPDEYYVYEK